MERIAGSAGRGTWDVSGNVGVDQIQQDITGHNFFWILWIWMGSVHSNILPQGSWPIACSRRLWKLDRLLPEIQYESY